MLNFVGCFGEKNPAEFSEGKQKTFVEAHGGAVRGLVDGGREDEVLRFGVVVVPEGLFASHVEDAELELGLKIA